MTLSSLSLGPLTTNLVSIPFSSFQMADQVLDPETGEVTYQYPTTQVEVSAFVVADTPVTMKQMRAYVDSEAPSYGVIGRDPTTGLNHIIKGGHSADVSQMTEAPFWDDFRLLDPLEILYGGAAKSIKPAKNWPNVNAQLPQEFMGDHNPAVNVSFFQALGFLSYLNEITVEFRSALNLGVFRLPRRAEQARLFKGPNLNLKYPTHDGILDMSRARYGLGNSGTTGSVYEFPELQFAGGVVYSLAGNIMELCSDYLAQIHERPRGVSMNPTGPRSGVFHVAGGGSYASKDFDLAAHVISSVAPLLASRDMGFRFVASILTPKP